MRWCWPAGSRLRASNAARCCSPRSMPANAISLPSSSCCGRASRRARRSTPPFSRHPARHRQFPGGDVDGARKPRGFGELAMTTSERSRLDGIGNLALVGAGKMGGAMLQSWLALGLPAGNITVIEPQPSPEIAALAKQGLSLNPKGRTSDIAALVVAVKPQIAVEALAEVAPLAGNDTLVLSIMAGRPLAFLERALPGRSIVR